MTLRKLGWPVLSCLLLLAACRGSEARHKAQPAGANPSVSAQMICRPETQTEIATALGVRTIAPVSPTWIAHLYSCRYVYSFGTMTLSVKELADGTTTTGYYMALRNRLGEKEDLGGLGQGGFAAPNGTVVVRKDYKVLEVDASGLPSQFGSPPTLRSDDAINVAATIMGCWTGA
jgi:hypothetical protein